MCILNLLSRRRILFGPNFMNRILAMAFVLAVMSGCGRGQKEERKEHPANVFQSVVRREYTNGAFSFDQILTGKTFRATIIDKTVLRPEPDMISKGFTNVLVRLRLSRGGEDVRVYGKDLPEVLLQRISQTVVGNEYEFPLELTYGSAPIY